MRDGTSLVLGTVPIRDVNRALGINLPEGDLWTTLAGYCLSLAGRIPESGARFTAADGTILARDPATPNAPAEPLDKLRLVNPHGSPLAKGIDSFLKVPNGGVLPPDPAARLTTGALEMSNVETADTLVQMIEAQRAFEQRAKIIATAGSLDEAGSGLMALR